MFSKERSKDISEQVREEMGKKVFIVASGPSLTDFGFNKLKNKDTIAVNHAVHSVPDPTYYITADSGVIRKSADNNFWKLGKDTVKIAVMGPEHKRYSKVKDVLYKFDKVIKPARFDGVIGFNYEDFATGKCTGFCALQLAVLLDYKRIYLLGIDLVAPEGKRHFYGKAGIPDASRCLGTFYEHFVTGINILHKESDVRVVSCSSISRLNQYIPFVPADKALE